MLIYIEIWLIVEQNGFLYVDSSPDMLIVRTLSRTQLTAVTEIASKL